MPRSRAGSGAVGVEDWLVGVGASGVEKRRGTVPRRKKRGPPLEVCPRRGSEPDPVQRRRHRVGELQQAPGERAAGGDTPGGVDEPTHQRHQLSFGAFPAVSGLVNTRAEGAELVVG